MPNVPARRQTDAVFKTASVSFAARYNRCAMPQLLRFASQDLPPDIKCQILSFLRIQWPEGFMGENLYRDWISRPEYQPVHFILVEQGILIAHTEVLRKDLPHAGETYRVIGLSGVFTYPAFRRQGYGRHIAEAGTQYIDASDADAGIFHCDSYLVGFYSACGWTPLLNARTYVTTKDGYVLSDEVMIMRFLSEKGKRGRAAFETEPVYFGESTW